MANIPSNTKFDQLLSAIKTKLEAITTIYEVVVGTYHPGSLGNKDAGLFPCCEILLEGWHVTEFISQRNLRGTFDFEIRAHTYAETVDRVSGTDMQNLESLAAVIRTQIYSFHDDVTDPCAGFRMVTGQFDTRLYYQEHTENVNTAIIRVSIMVDTPDTEA